MPTPPITEQILKNMDGATRAMNAYLDSQNKTPEKMAHFNRFMKTLGTQSEIFSRYGLYKQSVLHQINTQFSKEFSDTHNREITSYAGVVFIDFDNTILNQELYAQKYERYQLANQKIQTNRLNLKPLKLDLTMDNEFYNGIQMQAWKKLLQTLKSKNLLIVLCTSRMPILGEDDIFQQMVRNDLGSLFDKILLIGNIGFKGFVMRYIHGLIAVTYQNYFEPQSFWLIDDDLGHIDSASRCGFSVIQSQACIQKKFLMGYPQQWSAPPLPSHLDGIKLPSDIFTRPIRRDPIPDFIEKIYALPDIPDTPTVQSTQLPPSSPRASERRAQTAIFAPSTPLDPRTVVPLAPSSIPQMQNPQFDGLKQSPIHPSSASEHADFTIL